MVRVAARGGRQLLYSHGIAHCYNRVIVSYHRCLILDRNIPGGRRHDLEMEGGFGRTLLTYLKKSLFLHESNDLLFLYAKSGGGQILV